MFCKNCGKELKENAKFCAGCGTVVGSGANPTAQAPAAPEAQPVSAPAASADGTDTVADGIVGKSYVFDYYFLFNFGRARLSRVGVGFDTDNLLYAKGLKKLQIPYSIVREIRDENKTSKYMIFSLIVAVVLGILCALGGLIPVTVVCAVFAVLVFLKRKMRVVTIVTSDENKEFKIPVLPKNAEIDQFIGELKCKSGCNG